MNSDQSISSLPLMLVVSVFALLAVPPTSALAQHYILRLPQPISGTEVGRYFKELNCSHEQQFVILEFHREYIEEYSNWMTNEHVPAALRLSASDDVKNISDVISNYERLRTRSKAIESTFLTQIETILTSDQASLLPGVRQLRENNRLRQIASDALRQVSSASVDLRLLLAEMPSWDLGNKSVDAWMSEYRFASTRILRKIVRLSLDAPIQTEESMRYYDSLFDEIRADQKLLNVTAEGNLRQQLDEIQRKSLILKDRWQRLYRERHWATGLAWRDILLETCRLSVLNHRSIQTLKDETTDEVFRNLLTRYHRIGYREIPSSRGRAEKFFLTHRKANSNRSKESTDVAELMEVYRNEIDEVFRQMRLQVDDNIKSQIVDGSRIGSRMSNAQSEKMESLWTRYEEINTRTLQEFGKSTLVNDRVHLRKLMETDPRPRSDRMLHRSGVSFKTFDGRPIVVSRQVPSETDESWEQAFQWTVMPAPIRLDSVLRMANVLGIDREMKSVAQLLHDDYSFRWKRAAAPMSDLLREYKEIYRLTLAGENDDEDALSSRIDFRYDLYNELLKIFKELDAEFIDQYETLLDQVNQPLFALWKLSRQLELVRPALLEGTSGTYSLSGLRVSPGSDLIINRSQTRGTDLFIFLLEEFDSADWVNEETIATLSDYYAQSTVVISAIHTASMKCRRMLEDIYSEQVGVGVGTHVSELDTSMWGETMGRLCQENKHLLNLDRRTLELFRFKRHEMDDAGNDLLDRYLARAFPRLVPDAGLEIWLRTSLESVRLDQSQRTGIENLYTSYVQESKRDTHEMLSLALATIMQYSCDFNAPENLELTKSFLSSLRAAREKKKLLDSNTEMRLRVILGDDSS